MRTFYFIGLTAMMSLGVGYGVFAYGGDSEDFIAVMLVVIYYEILRARYND